jgi:3-oxoacyl-[acyl-carrier-protein] synthase III
MSEVLEAHPYPIKTTKIEGFYISDVTQLAAEYGTCHNITCGIGHWGLPFPIKERAEDVAKRFGKDIDETWATVKASGFHTTWNYPPGYPFNSTYNEELHVIGIGVNTVLAFQGWNLSDVEAVIVGSSSPRELNYAERIVEYIGLPAVHMMNFYLACNSSAQALGYALTTKELSHKKVLIVGVDGLGSQVTEISPELTDHLAPIFFGNGFFIIAFEPGKHLQARLWHLDHVEDKKRALAWLPSYSDIVNNAEGAPIIQQNEQYRAVFVKPPIPSDGRILNMRGVATAAFFSKEVAKRIVRILEEFDGHIHHWAFHHPSEGVIALVNKQLVKKGVKDLQLGWMDVPCNSSGSTIGLSLITALQKAKPGENIAVVGFGAGATISTGVLRMV